jgi:hypothetical protein
MALKLKLFLCVIVAFLMVTFSCSNDGDDPNQNPNPNPEDCKVISYRCQDRDESIVIVYSGDGALDSIKSGNYDMTKWDLIKTFSYDLTSPKITVKKYLDGTLLGESHSVETDGFGKVFSIRDIDAAVPPAVESWKQVTFDYDDDTPSLVDKSIFTTISDPTSQAVVSDYTWDVASPAGWNMTILGTPSGVYTYAYDLTKPTQAGDFLNFDKLLSTFDHFYRPISSVNLLSAVYVDDELLVDVTYNFDTDGRIISFSAHWDGTGEPEVWELAYDCD